MAIFEPVVSLDDCHVRSDGLFTGATNYLFFGNIGGGLGMDAGIRFLNVTIPKGNTILTAKLTFQATYSDSGATCNTQVKGEAVDDAATFVDTTDFLGRARTTAYINWGAIPAWTENTDYDSPDISTIIQEIINRSGWASGNDLVLFVANNGSSSGAYREPKSINFGTGLCTRLTVTHAVPSGIRNNIMIF
jgi:hypothetical protein